MHADTASPLAWKIKTAPYHLSLLTRLWTACPLAWPVTRLSKQPHVWLLWPCKLPSPLMEPPYFPKFQLAKNRWRDLTAHLFSLMQRQKEKHKKENGGELTRRTQKELGKSFGEGTLLFLKLVQGEDSLGVRKSHPCCPHNRKQQSFFTATTHVSHGWSLSCRISKRDEKREH